CRCASRGRKGAGRRQRLRASRARRTRIDRRAQRHLRARPPRAPPPRGSRARPRALRTLPARSAEGDAGRFGTARSLRARSERTLRFRASGERTMIRQAFILALAVPLLSGCYQSIRIDDPDESPPPWDAGPPTTDDASRPPDGAPRPRDAGPFEPPGTCVEATGVDLLLVVDNSNSMHEEQESLAAALPTLVTALVSPPDEDGDGEPDWLPVTDLQIGVITTDM